MRAEPVGELVVPSMYDRAKRPEGTMTTGAERVRLAELAALVDRAGRLRRDVARAFTMPGPWAGYSLSAAKSR
jgi:hypothetical protein